MKNQSHNILVVTFPKLSTQSHFVLLTLINKILPYIRVEGVEPAGQLQAVIAGISKALNELDREKFRPILKKKGLLTRDARVRQRRKSRMGGKSRRKKQSPKR